MKALFPPLLDPAPLPRRVLVVAPHADDEVLGCGGMLAFHAARGDAVRVLVLTDGAQGDPRHGGPSDLAAARRAESRAAGSELGVHDYRFLGLADGTLGGCAGLAETLRAELADFAPGLVYGPSLEEMHPDHRAAARALCAAALRDGGPRLLLYGVNGQVTANVLFDTTALFPRKRAAIERFTSQLAYHDMVHKTEAVDRARTVNVDLPGVHYAAGFADLGRAELARYAGGVRELLAAVHGPELDDGLPAATAVISTWNKRGVVTEAKPMLKVSQAP